MPVKNASKEQVLARIHEAGEQARAEAEARRLTTKPVQMPKEIDGPKGPEPTRYTDWERNGIVSDF